MKTSKGYTGCIEFEPRDEIFVGHLVGIADIVSFHGASVKELKQEFHDAVDAYLEMSEKLNAQRRNPIPASCCCGSPQNHMPRRQWRPKLRGKV